MRERDPHSTPCVEIIVVEVKGSAPREAGARMLWFPGGGIEGTIGGGNLEHQCLEEARALWADRERTTALREYPLSASLGQCCGGWVRVFLQKRLPPRRLVICGAGHVGAAVARILADSPLRVSVVDARPDWVVAERFPPAVEVVPDDPEAWLQEMAAQAERIYLLIMTHNHALDEALCRLALRLPFAWVGLIGSRTKWRRFRHRLAARGFGEEELARIVSPIGDPALGKTPQEIAVGVAAQVLAVFHGARWAGARADTDQPGLEIGKAERTAAAPGLRAGLILAGGASSRMGRWKGGLLYGGKALVTAHAEALTAAGADLWMVVYPEQDRAEAERLIPPGHRVPNPTPEAPLFASIQRGLRALIRQRPEVDSLLLTPVDMVPLDPDWLAALWDRHEASGAWCTRPEAATGDPERPVRPGHPVVLDQRLFATILAADPSEARLDFLLRDLPEDRTAALEVPDPAILSNLNTPEDYAGALAE